MSLDIVLWVRLCEFGFQFFKRTYVSTCTYIDSFYIIGGNYITLDATNTCIELNFDVEKLDFKKRAENCTHDCSFWGKSSRQRGT